MFCICFASLDCKFAFIRLEKIFSVDVCYILLHKLVDDTSITIILRSLFQTSRVYILHMQPTVEEHTIRIVEEKCYHQLCPILYFHQLYWGFKVYILFLFLLYRVSRKSLKLGKFEYFHYGSSCINGDIQIFLTLMTFRAYPMYHSFFLYY